MDAFGVERDDQVSKAYDKKRGKEGAKYGAKAGATVGGAAGVAAGGLQAADYVSDRRAIGRWSTYDGRAIINGKMPNSKAATLIARHAGKQGAKGALVGGAALGALGAGAGFKKKKKVSKGVTYDKKRGAKDAAEAGAVGAGAGALFGAKYKTPLYRMSASGKKMVPERIPIKMGGRSAKGALIVGGASATGGALANLGYKKKKKISKAGMKPQMQQLGSAANLGGGKAKTTAMANLKNGVPLGGGKPSNQMSGLQAGSKGFGGMFGGGNKGGGVKNTPSLTPIKNAGGGKKSTMPVGNMSQIKGNNQLQKMPKKAM